MRRLILAALFVVGVGGAAHAACPAVLSDCPSVNANTGAFAGPVTIAGVPVGTVSNSQPTNRSGTVTLGGSAQTLMAANSARNGCEVQNLSSGDLWINELGSAAAAAQPSKWLPAGSFWTCAQGGTSLLAVSIFGATTGQAFAAREW